VTSSQSEVVDDGNVRLRHSRDVSAPSDDVNDTEDGDNGRVCW